MLLIRHAESLGQAPDADLSPKGQEQARALTPQLKNIGITELFSSPYRRAIATVAPFAESAGLQVRTIDDLRERKLGEGLLPDFLVHMERSFADERYCMPGCESLVATAERGIRGLAEVDLSAQSCDPAIASHGNLIASVIRTLDPHFGFDAWKAMKNPDLFHVEFENGRLVTYQRLEPTR